MTRLEAIAAELGVTPIEARRMIAAKIRETLTAVEKPRTRVAWSEGEIVDALRAFHAATGRLPKKAEYDPHGTPALPSRKTVARRFGTVAIALEAAGLVEMEQSTLFVAA